MLRTCCCERLKLRSTRSGRPCASRRSAALPDRRLTGRPTRAEGEVNDTDARLWHPWLRINRVLRVMLQTRWSAEARPRVKAEFTKALALRSQIRRAGWFNEARDRALLMRRRAGARRGVRLDFPPAIPSEVRVRLIGLAVVLAVGLFTAPLVAKSQQVGKV